MQAERQTQTIGVPSSKILPGSTIGMVGSGQLGKMFAHAATAMGYRVAVFASEANEPAAQVASDVVVGDLHRLEDVAEFAKGCDVITLEFENIPSRSIECCSEFAPTHPSSALLAVAQDRLIEKRVLSEQAGLPVAPFATVTNTAEVVSFADQHGWPVIVKTTRSGYDGKGQHRLEHPGDADRVAWDSSEWVAEKFIPFDREASVIVARSSTGEIRCFDPIENRHENHILDVSRLPSTLSNDQCASAIKIATRAAEFLELVGVLCVELFVESDGGLLVNEIAPRPHNSGHLTIEACHTSQFEQQVRAICGLPLGDPSLRVGGASMANLLGDLWSDSNAPNWPLVLENPGLSLHLYGKAVAKRGRKMGHLTATAADSETAVQRVCQARSEL